jgi:hypothetical protein
MRVSQYPRWLGLLQHGTFVFGLSTSAYLAFIQTLTSRGVDFAWYHRLGLAALCLLSAWAVMVLPGLVLVVAFWIGNRLGIRVKRRA